MPREHSHLPRLYVEPALSAGAMIEIGKDQSSHLLTVRRMKDGDGVVMFNGRDGAWLSRITRSDKKGATLEAVVQTAHQTPPSDLWFGFAPLKTGRLDYLVQKATEMGAGVIQPVITEYTQVHRLKDEKLHAYVMDAAEQCEVLSLPTIAPETGLRALLENWRSHHGLRRLLFADEAAASDTPAETIEQLRGLPVGLLVGPEGGFSAAERDLLRAQDYVVPISLGPRILRADTAAVAALAVIQAIIGDWR